MAVRSWAGDVIEVRRLPDPTQCRNVVCQELTQVHKMADRTSNPPRPPQHPQPSTLSGQCCGHKVGEWWSRPRPRGHGHGHGQWNGTAMGTSMGMGAGMGAGTGTVKGTATVARPRGHGHHTCSQVRMGDISPSPPHPFPSRTNHSFVQFRDETQHQCSLS